MRLRDVLALMGVSISSCAQLGKGDAQPTQSPRLIPSWWSGREIYFADRAGTIYRLQQ